MFRPVLLIKKRVQKFEFNLFPLAFLQVKGESDVVLVALPKCLDDVM